MAIDAATAITGALNEGFTSAIEKRAAKRTDIAEQIADFYAELRGFGVESEDLAALTLPFAQEIVHIELNPFGSRR